MDIILLTLGILTPLLVLYQIFHNMPKVCIIADVWLTGKNKPKIPNPLFRRKYYKIKRIPRSDLNNLMAIDVNNMELVADPSISIKINNKEFYCFTIDDHALQFNISTHNPDKNIIENHKFFSTISYFKHNGWKLLDT